MGPTASGKTDLAISLLDHLPIELINQFSEKNTIEDALNIIEQFNIELANKLWKSIAKNIEIRSVQYVNRHIASNMEIGAALFDKKRNIRCTGIYGESHMKTAQS